MVEAENILWGIHLPNFIYGTYARRSEMNRSKKCTHPLMAYTSSSDPSLTFSFTLTPLGYFGQAFGGVWLQMFKIDSKHHLMWSTKGVWWVCGQLSDGFLCAGDRDYTSAGEGGGQDECLSAALRLLFSVLFLLPLQNTYFPPHTHTYWVREMQIFILYRYLCVQGRHLCHFGKLPGLGLDVTPLMFGEPDTCDSLWAEKERWNNIKFWYVSFIILSVMWNSMVMGRYHFSKCFFSLLKKNLSS